MNRNWPKGLTELFRNQHYKPYVTPPNGALGNPLGVYVDLTDELPQITAKKVYKAYTREDDNVQTSGRAPTLAKRPGVYTRETEAGYFSLNMTAGSAEQLPDFMQVNAGDSVGWVGCGDARQLIFMALRHPYSFFEGFDVNKEAILMARRKAALLGCKNATFQHRDALKELKKFNLVFSTAIAGPELYIHLGNMVETFDPIRPGVLIVLDEMRTTERIPQNSLSVKLMGSGGQKMLVKTVIK